MLFSKFNKQTLKIAVVGHTNTGKTSLIRTLLRDFKFGEVKDAPSTTIDVSQIQLINPILPLYFSDTPGFEDPIGLADQLDLDFPITARSSQMKRIEDFIKNEQNYPEFEQEIKILKSVMRADCIFYIIDTREDALAKYEEEINILMQCATPILPILNFTHDLLSKVQAWEATLKTLSLHNFLSFDTISPPKERRLYEKLASLMNYHYESITQLVIYKELEDRLRYEKAITYLSDFFINITTLQIQCPQDLQIQNIQAKLHNKIMVAENELSMALLDMYGFSEEDLHLYPLPIKKLDYSPDFFRKDNLLTLGERFGLGMVAGASIGAGADLLVGFTSLGLASALGGVLGGLGNTLRFYGNKLQQHLNKIEIYCLDPMIILYLLERMSLLVNHLEGRSHADVRFIELGKDSAINNNKFSEFFVPLIKALQHKSEYSRFNSNFSESNSRVKIINKIKNKLLIEEHSKDNKSRLD